VYTRSRLKGIITNCIEKVVHNSKNKKKRSVLDSVYQNDSCMQNISKLTVVVIIFDPHTV
jgi:hypothetical protein